VLRRQPVLGHHPDDPARERQAADQRPVRRVRAHHVAAAVQVQQHVPLAAPRGPHPLGREPRELAPFDPRVGRQLGADAHPVERLALTGERHPDAERRGDGVDEHLAQLISDFVVHRLHPFSHPRLNSDARRPASRRVTRRRSTSARCCSHHLPRRTAITPHNLAPSPRRPHQTSFTAPERRSTLQAWTRPSTSMSSSWRPPSARHFATTTPSPMVGPPRRWKARRHTVAQRAVNSPRTSACPGPRQRPSSPATTRGRPQSTFARPPSPQSSYPRTHLVPLRAEVGPALGLPTDTVL
jgi:hypothetical protein